MSNVYVIVGHHEEPNVYYNQLLNLDKKGSPKVVNQHQLFDLNHSNPPSMINFSFDGDFAIVPSFLHSNKTSNVKSNINLSEQQSHH